MELKMIDINFEDIRKFGVNVKYVEDNIAVIEARLMLKLEEYFKQKFPDRKIYSAIPKGLCYNNIGGFQDCMVEVTFENDLFSYGSDCFKLSYSPYENYKRDHRVMKLNKLEYLNPKVPSDWDYICNKHKEVSSVDFTIIH